MRVLIIFFMALSVGLYAGSGKKYGKLKKELIFDADVTPQEIETIEIDPAARAADFEEAFKALRKDHPRSNIYAIIEGRSFDHIVDLKAMGSGTLVMLKTRHHLTEREHIVKVEDIEELGQRKASYSGSPVRYPDSW